MAQPQPRLVEGPAVYAAPPPAPGLTFWQFTLRAVVVVVVLISMAALAYFLLSGRSQPFAQLQEQPQQQAAAEQGEEAPPQQQAQAERLPEPEAEPRQVPSQQPVPTDLGPRLAMPSDDKLLMLINSSLIALNQANTTGNYTVLRDMAAPGFQEANSPERLAKVFSNLRNRKLDLTPVLLFQPKLYQKPAMSDRGMIRITGYFPTEPERVNFDLIFQPVHGKWRLYGIAANTQRVNPAQGAPGPQGGPAPAAAPPAAAKPAAAEAVKPAAPVKKPAAKPKPAEAEIDDSAPPDVRDRIDSPPPAPPAEKPKQKSGWNPFGR